MHPARRGGQRGQHGGLIGPGGAVGVRRAIDLPGQQHGKVEVHQAPQPAGERRAQRREVAGQGQVAAEPAHGVAILVAILEDQAIEQALRPAVQPEGARGQQHQRGSEAKAAAGLGQRRAGQMAPGGDGGPVQRQQPGPEGSAHQPALQQGHVQDVVAQDGVGEAGRQQREGQDGVLRSD